MIREYYKILNPTNPVGFILQTPLTLLGFGGLLTHKI